MATTKTGPFSLGRVASFPGLEEALARPLESLDLGCHPLAGRQLLGKPIMGRWGGEQNRLSVPQPRGGLSGADCAAFLSWSSGLSLPHRLGRDVRQGWL